MVFLELNPQEPFKQSKICKSATKTNMNFEKVNQKVSRENIYYISKAHIVKDLFHILSL